MLIGLGGKAGAGKDEVADILVNAYDFEKLGMSDPLNEALLTLDPLVPRRWRRAERYSVLHARVGYVKAKRNPEVRRLLQTLGTDVVRNMIGRDTWVNIASEKIEALLEEGIDVVLTAARFINEVDMVRRLGGVLIYIDRPEQDFINMVNGTHEAEQSVSPVFFDKRLSNNGTLQQLTVATLTLFDSIWEERFEKGR